MKALYLTNLSMVNESRRGMDEILCVQRERSGI